jgi:hypothetical protein
MNIDNRGWVVIDDGSPRAAFREISDSADKEPAKIEIENPGLKMRLKGTLKTYRGALHEL